MYRCKIRSEVESSEESGEIGRLEIAVNEDGSVAWPAWSRLTQTVVHQGPMGLKIVESWEVDGQGERTCNAAGARRLQTWINDSITAATTVTSPQTRIGEGELLGF